MGSIIISQQQRLREVALRTAPRFMSVHLGLCCLSYHTYDFRTASRSTLRCPATRQKVAVKLSQNSPSDVVSVFNPAYGGHSSALSAK